MVGAITMHESARIGRPQKGGRYGKPDVGRTLVEALFRSVKRLCHAGLDSVTLRREVAARMVPQLGFDAHAFSTCDPDTGLMTHTVAEGVPSALARRYLEELYPHHCACLTMDLPRVGIGVYTGAHDTPAMRAEVEAGGIHWQLHASFVAGNRLWGTWCLMRERGAELTDARGRALLERLVPHLARGLRSAALIDQGATSRRGGDPATGAGVIVLDERHRPILRTALASSWLDDLADDGLWMEDRLPMAVHALASRLRRARTDVAASLRARARGKSGRWYSLRASLAEPNEYGVSATVIMVAPAALREIAGLLSHLYELSAREREVVAAVARGESTKSIAASLGVSAHTVLEHIERACHKIGVRGRKALVAKLFFEGYSPLAGERSA
jgi:DNA-binding CsgD family transcriptional regulator